MLELQRNIVVLRRWWWLLLLGAVIGGASAYILTKTLARPQYEATAVVLVGTSPKGQNAAYFSNVPGVPNGQLLMNRAALETVQRAVPGAVASSLADSVKSTASQQDCVSIDENPCKLLFIQVQWKDPAAARRVANALAAVLVRQGRQRLEQGYALYHRAIVAQERVLAKQIRASAGSGPAMNWLQAQYANSLSDLYKGDANTRVQVSTSEAALQIARPAPSATRLPGPRAPLNAAIGAVLGLLVGWVLAFAMTTSYDQTSDAAPLAVISNAGERVDR